MYSVVAAVLRKVAITVAVRLCGDQAGACLPHPSQLTTRTSQYLQGESLNYNDISSLSCSSHAKS